MATLYLRNVDDKVAKKLRERAKKNHRSVTQEALLILRQSLVGEDPKDLFKTIDLLREEAYRRYGALGDSTSIIREGRNR